MSAKTNKALVKTDDMFLLATEYGIGHSIDEDKINIPVDYYAPSADIEKVKQMGLSNGFRIWIDPDARKLARASAGGYGMMIDFWITEGRMELFAKKKGLGLKEYIDLTVDVMMRYMRKYGKKVMWNVWPEIDNPINPYNWGFWPERFSSRVEFHQFLKDHFTTDKYCRYRDERVITQYDPSIGFKKPALQYIRERGLDRKRLNLSVLACRMSMAHHYFDWGFDFVQQEMNVNYANVQTAIAFLRGAAKQYRGGWGLDPAPWKAPIVYPSVYDANGNRLGGVSESLLLREWMVSFLSGTNYIGEQVSDSTHWITEKKTGKKHLSPMGRMAKDFADFTLRRHPDRGQTCVPVAILLEKHHGWDCPFGEYGEIKQACMGEIPYEPKDDMIEAFFAYAFPGYQERHRYPDNWWQMTPESAEKRYQSNKAKIAAVRFRPNYEWQKPYGAPHKQSKRDRDLLLAKKEAYRAGLDTRQLEQGELVNSTLGDSFNVFLEDVPLKVLREYPLVVLLGGIQLTEALQDKLSAYVAGGGKLLVNMAQASRDNEKFLGVSFTGRKNKTGKAYCKTCSRVFDEGRNVFEYDVVKPVTAEVWATAGAHRGGAPLVTRRKLGKGEIWFNTIPYGIKPKQKLHARLLEITADLTRHLIQPLQSVVIEGRPIEYLVNKTSKGRIIALINNNAECWQGKITIKGYKTGDNIKELWTDRDMWGYTVRNNEISFSPAVPPFMFMIIGVGNY